MQEIAKIDEMLLEKIIKVPALRDFGRAALQGLLQLSKIRMYDPGEAIIVEGTLDSWIYFLLSGKAVIMKDNKEVGQLSHRGDVFGEMGVIDGSVRSASVLAEEDCVCLAIDISYIEFLSDKNKVINWRGFAELLVRRLRRTTEEMVRCRDEVTRLKEELKKVSGRK